MIDSKVPLLDSQSTSESPQPDQMADASADQLMKELFNDVELALEGDADALEKIAQPDLAEPTPASELTLSFAEAGLPSGLSDLSEASQTTELATLPTPLVPVASDSPGATTEGAKLASETSKAPRFWTMNRALLGAAGLMLLATLGVWMQQRQQAEVATATAPVPAPTEAPVADTNAEFLEYLRRSLDVIAQNAANTAPATTANVGDVAIAPNSSAVGLPPIGNNTLPPGVPNGLPTAPGSVNVIERVYVPYPSSQVAAAAPANANAPATTTNSTGAVTGNTTNTAAAQNSQKLLGVLELGDRSAALFEIEGVPQRVYIGERVGNSGWSLVSVANEEAVVRRNGEVRTLYIGQQF